MFQLGVLLFLSLAVSLSSGQDVTLSESSSSSGTCNITYFFDHRDYWENISCDANTKLCLEAFNESRSCLDSVSEFTCSQRIFTVELISIRWRAYGPFLPWVSSEPYACYVQGRDYPDQDDVCLCHSPDYDDRPLLPLLSIGFGLYSFSFPS